MYAGTPETAVAECGAEVSYACGTGVSYAGACAALACRREASPAGGAGEGSKRAENCTLWITTTGASRATTKTRSSPAGA